MTDAPPGEAASHQPPARRIHWPLLLLKIAVSVGLVGWLVWNLQRSGRFATMGKTLGGVMLPWLAAAFALQLAGMLVAAWRWRVLLDAQDMRIPYRSLLNSYLAAAFFNTFLPGMYGGDVIRAYDSTKHTGETTKSITVVVLGRIAGLVALVGIALVAMAVNWPAVRGHVGDIQPLLWALGLLVAGLLFLWAFTIPPVARLMLRLSGRGRLNRVLDKVLTALAVYRARPRHTLAVLGLSVVFQLIVVVYYYLCTKALGLPVPLHRMMMAAPVVLVLMMVVPAINSIGVRSVGFGMFLFAGLSGDVDPAAAGLSLEVVDLALRLALGLVGAAAFVITRRGR